MLVIDAQSLGADGFRIDLGALLGKDGAAEGPTSVGRMIELGPTRGISGRYVFADDEQRLEAIGCSCVRVAGARWDFGSLGLRIPEKLVIDELNIDLTIPRGSRGPVRGTITARRISAAGASLVIAGVPQPIELDDLCLESIRVEFVAGEVRLKIGELHAGCITFSNAGARVVAHAVTLAEGIELLGSEFSCPKVEFETVELSLQDLDFKPRPKPTREPPPQPIESGIWENPRPYAQSGWWNMLDRLDGQFDVDLRVDVTVPLIGRRRATHHFRIPIHGGVINFIGVERNLAALEDAVLDFRVRDGRLALVKDIPLVPLDRKTLVYWVLAPDEAVLAERNEVRLRRLLDYRLPRSSKLESDDKPSRFALRSLAFDNLLFTASLRSAPSFPLWGGRLSLGDAESPALASMCLRGDLRHEPGAVTNPRTALELDLRGLLVGLDDLPVGGQRLSLGAVAVKEVVGAKVNFEGVMPRSLTARLTGVRVLRVNLRRQVEA